MASAIELGHTLRGNRPVYLKPDIRATHMQILGASGRGKSKFMEHLIREDILEKRGLCLIDPHGYLYDDVVKWCATKRFLGRRKIVLFDPSSGGWTFGFNPLNFANQNSEEIAYCVDAMVKACAQVWGGEDQNRTPLLKRCLRATFHVLVEESLTLHEALELTNPYDKSGMRRYITRAIRDPVFRGQWETFNSIREREFLEQFSSTTNRLLEFLASPVTRTITGQRERVVDFRSLMDEGAIVLVNLASGGRLSDDNARLLGTLLVNDLFLKARSRPKGSRPFYLYIDECGQFVNDDIGRILDEARKFGLHLVLAHQHLSQLKKAGEEVYSAVMTNAQTKVVFGGLSPEDARTMAELIFMGEHDLQEAKEQFDKPSVIGYVTRWLKSYSSGEILTRNEQSGAAASESRGVIANGGDEPRETSASGTTSHQMEGTGHTGHTTRGKQEALTPIIETLPSQPYSLEEQIYKSMALMINQPTQRAIVKLPGERSRRIRTPDVEDGYANDQRVERFKHEIFSTTPFASPLDQAQQELALRRQELERQAKAYREGDPPETFRE